MEKPSNRSGSRKIGCPEGRNVSIMGALWARTGSRRNLGVIVVIASIWLTFATQVVAESPFAIVPREHWSYQVVEKLFSLGLVAENSNSFHRFGYSVSRYEMALWVAQVFDSLSYDINNASSSNNSTEPVTNTTTSRLVNLKELVTYYNSNPRHRPLSVADTKLLVRLAGFLAEELKGFGYIITDATEGPVPVTSLVPMSFANRTMSVEVGEGKLQVGPTAELGSGNPFEMGLWGSPSTLQKSSPNPAPVGVGFTLELGDLLVTAGKGVLPSSQGNTGATALGLRYRLPQMDIQVGYTSEVEFGLKIDALGGKRKASAGLEYSISPASSAGAGFSLSDDPVAKVTTTDLGLRYQQKDASVMLGYRLVDLSASQPVGQPDTYNNVATAEFSVRF